MASVKLKKELKKALRTKTLSLLMSGLLTAAAFPVQAHHPVQAKFDPQSNTTLTGIVTNVDWKNPHVHVFMNVNDGGEVLNWAVELESPLTLKASGWSEESLQPGDRIRVDGLLARNGSRQLWGDAVMSLDTGRAVYTLEDTSPVPPLVPRPAPRWPDGQVALGSTSAVANGYWGYPTEKVLVEDGVEVEMDRFGQLADIADAAKVAPLQDWALGIYRHRQQRDLRDDPTWHDCKPYAGPRQYQSDFGIKLLEDKPGQRVFVLMGSGNHNYRIIYMDGREQTGQVGGDDDNPLFFGRSVGHWEGDTLVVNTTGFNENFWFSNGGLPHTSLLTLHERFSRPDMETLHYEVTIEDPGAYTRNWTASWDLKWVGGEELPVHFCQNNRP